MEDQNYKIPALTLIDAIMGDPKLQATGKYKLVSNPNGTVQAYANSNFADNTDPANWVEIADEPPKTTPDAE